MAWQSFKRPSRKTFGIRWAVFRHRSGPASPSTSPVPVLVPASAPEFFQKVTRSELWVKRHANWPRSLMGCIKRGAGGEGRQLQEVGAAPKFQMKSQRAKIVEHFFSFFHYFFDYSFCLGLRVICFQFVLCAFDVCHCHCHAH